jgi:hypothetical protein
MLADPTALSTGTRPLLETGDDSRRSACHFTEEAMCRVD